MTLGGRMREPVRVFEPDPSSQRDIHHLPERNPTTSQTLGRMASHQKAAIADCTKKILTPGSHGRDGTHHRTPSLKACGIPHVARKGSPPRSPPLLRTRSPRHEELRKIRAARGAVSIEIRGARAPGLEQQAKVDAVHHAVNGKIRRAR